VLDRECLVDDVYAVKLEPLNKLKAEVKGLFDQEDKKKCENYQDIKNLYDYYTWMFKALEKPGCKRHQDLDRYIAEFTECARDLKVARNNYLPHFAYEFHTCMAPANQLYKFI
jgi:hypothetical protein